MSESYVTLKYKHENKQIHDLLFHLIDIKNMNSSLGFIGAAVTKEFLATCEKISPNHGLEAGNNLLKESDKLVNCAGVDWCCEDNLEGEDFHEARFVFGGVYFEDFMKITRDFLPSLKIDIEWSIEGYSDE